MSKIRVIIGDDHPLVRSGIREELQKADDILVVAEASRSDDIQRLCEELTPDVVLLDIQMPGPKFTETISFLHTRYPNPHIIILTAHNDDVYIRWAIEAGIQGYVLKNEVVDAIIRAIHCVVTGGTWFSSSLLSRAFANKRDTPQLSSDPNRETTGASLDNNVPPSKILTRQQRKVLRLAEHELTNDEIARELTISAKTVKKHLEDIYKRLGAHDRETAARIAREGGYI
jgi:DNA-binding NarL/FixJ family response regulator